MSEKYPFVCCRCGFCCLSETCPAGQEFYGVRRLGLCPGLSFNDQTGNASCALAHILPTGDGCCIKARAIKDGITYDFAGLPSVAKRSVGQAARTARGL